MKLLRSLSLIINLNTLVVTSLALGSTLLCEHYGLMADFPLTIIGVAIVFPIVFSINSAYSRRETALANLGDFINHMNALYYASRDWIKPAKPQFTQQAKQHLIECFDQMRELFTSVDEQTIHENEKKLAEKISDLSRFVQQFRELGIHGTEMSRIDQYMARIGGAIENMKVVLKYRTPITLRAYSKISIYSFTISYGPYFVFAARDYTSGLAYVMPVVFSFILVSLDNIQAHLENPFDQIGEDDIKFGTKRFEEMLD
ncbi:MAG: bestrophin family ion channel [Bacteroidota bacterium]